jgi:protein arginine kinase activator
MKCELCGEQDASIHVRQIVGNEVTDIHLCEACATEKGITSSNKKIEVSLSQLLTGLVDTAQGKTTGSDDLSCPGCGLQYAELRKEGRMGCAECYEAFHDEVKTLVTGLGGTAQHRGKYPSKILQYKTFLIDREKLKERLQQAVRDEDYETAARLRDRIDELERATEDDDEEL